MPILVKLVVILVALLHVKCEMNSTSKDGEESIVLSRRKRFLVFPEGSSVQLGKLQKLYLICY